MKPITLLCVAFIMVSMLLPLNTALASNDVLASYRLVAETDRLELYYNEEQSSIKIKDKSSNFIWSSAVDENEYDKEKIDNFWIQNFNSLFNIGYTDLKEENDQVKLSSSASEESEITTKSIENGISLSYYLKTLDVRLTIEFSLEGDSLNVKIPANGIKESDKTGIVFIEVMPFFGSANDLKEGYVFYPDGCGAVSYFKNIHPEYIEKYRGIVYGLDTVDIDAYDAFDRSGKKETMLPVFGIKNEGNAFVAIMTEGEYDSAINFSPSGYQINMNRACAEFIYRRLYRATRPNTALVDRIEKNILLQDHEIKYIFLKKDEADYNGMANAYRKYLQDENKIRKVIPDKSNIPINLDFIMGIKEERLMFDKFIKMTTFDQLEKILQEFYNEGIKDMNVNLLGWTKKGYKTYPLHLPPNRQIGGYRGLRKLSKFTDKKGINLFLQDNFIDAYSENGGFSSYSDVVRQRNGLVSTNKFSNRFILNPYKSVTYFNNKFVSNLKKYPINGINFEKFGSLIYYDYHKDHPFARKETAKTWDEFMEQSKKQLGSAAVRGGNAYVFKTADLMYDIPTRDSGYFFTDESVPFYQMVIHGYIPYSSEPFNMFYDNKVQRLKAIEYGCVPYYQLTYKSSDYMRYTSYNQLFTSKYDYWMKDIIRNYVEFNQKFKEIWSQPMIEHTKVMEGVYKVTYENGKKVYVNYNNEMVVAEGNEIEPLDYLVAD